MIRSIIFSAMILVGIIAFLFSVTVNLYVDDIVQGTNLSVVLGEPIEKYRLEIMAIMSGGKLLIVPLWIQITVGSIGCLLVWLGAQGFILKSQGLDLKEVATLKFWTKVQAKFVYEK